MARPEEGTILIVDDATTVRTLVELKLRSALPQFHFRQAATGLQALEEIVRQPPSAVLLDVNMPVVDGSAVLVLLRQARRMASEALVAALQASPAVAGHDRATMRVTDPLHARRGSYEDEAVDGLVEGLAREMQERHGADLDVPRDHMALTALPRYLVGEIVARPQLAAMPVILLTTLSEEGQMERLRRLGPADATLCKPFDATHAGRLISELIARLPH